MIFSYIRQVYCYYFSQNKTLAKRIYSVIGIRPVRINLYKLALQHKSISPEYMEVYGNNERLEYLGDSIISTIVADYLYSKYPLKNEGFLTKMRSKIVKRKTLNHVADSMGIDILLTEFSALNTTSSILGNALEAIIGAYYLERGYAKTKRFVIHKILRKYLDFHELEEKDDNFKSQLLEWCQKYNLEIDYKLVEKYRFNKRDRFKIAVLIDDVPVSFAEDYNKKSAEQSASKIALKKLQLEKQQDIEKSS